MTVLVWLVLLASKRPFEERCDLLKVFYARKTWKRR